MGITESRTARVPAEEPLFANRRQMLVYGFELLVVALLYYSAAKLSLRVALVGDTVTPVWPPTGIAVVALLVFGKRIWPAIAIAALLANLSPGLFWLAAVIAVGNTAAPLVAHALLERADFRPDMERLRDVVGLVLLGALVPMAVSATVGSAALRLGPPRNAFGSTWLVWWTGDSMGVLVFAPLLLLLMRTRLTGRSSWSRRVEAAGLIAGSIAIAYLATRSDLSILYLTFPFVIWAALRFQLRGVAPVVTIVTSMAVSAAVDDVGPFGGRDLVGKMVTLQAFNYMVALMGYLLAALTTERSRARTALDDLRRRQAFELNDEIIQGLSVVKYAMELKDDQTAERAVERTLDSARAIVKDLLHSPDEGLGPGDLVRERAADLNRAERGDE